MTERDFSAHYFFTDCRLLTTKPVNAKSAMVFGMTIRLLNISDNSHTKSLDASVPKKMNANAITV